MHGVGWGPSRRACYLRMLLHSPRCLMHLIAGASQGAGARGGLAAAMEEGTSRRMLTTACSPSMRGAECPLAQLTLLRRCVHGGGRCKQALRADAVAVQLLQLHQGFKAPHALRAAAIQLRGICAGLLPNHLLLHRAVGVCVQQTRGAAG